MLRMTRDADKRRIGEPVLGSKWQLPASAIVIAVPIVIAMVAFTIAIAVMIVAVSAIVSAPAAIALIGYQDAAGQRQHRRKQ